MIDTIIDKLVEILNRELGPESSSTNKIDSAYAQSITEMSPNKSIGVVDGQIEPGIFEIGINQPATWKYNNIELQLICKGTELLARDTRRTFLSLIRQTLYNSDVRAEILALESTIGDEREKVLKYDVIRIKTDFGKSKSQFIYIAVFQLNFETEINIV